MRLLAHATPAASTTGARSDPDIAAGNGHVAAAPASHAPGTNPWVDAVARGRTEFAGAFGDLARSRRNWQLAAFGALGVAGVMSVGFYALATQARITPYVVEVDRLGRARASGPAERMAAADDRIVTSAVASWVRDIRAVVADAVAQQDQVRRAYAFVDQGTASWLDAYMTDPARDPRVLAGTLSRTVEVTSVLPLPGAGPRRGQVASGGSTTWKVTWVETDYPRGGGQATAAAWEGYVTTRQVSPTTTDRMEVNPLGLFVTSVNWTQIAARQPVGQGGAPTPATDGAVDWSGPQRAAPAAQATAPNTGASSATPSAVSPGGTL